MFPSVLWGRGEGGGVDRGKEGNRGVGMVCGMGHSLELCHGSLVGCAQSPTRR